MNLLYEHPQYLASFISHFTVSGLYVFAFCVWDEKLRYYIIVSSSVRIMFMPYRGEWMWMSSMIYFPFAWILNIPEKLTDTKSTVIKLLFGIFIIFFLKAFCYYWIRLGRVDGGRRAYHVPMPKDYTLISEVEPKGMMNTYEDLLLFFLQSIDRTSNGWYMNRRQAGLNFSRLLQISDFYGVFGVCLLGFSFECWSWQTLWHFRLLEWIFFYSYTTGLWDINAILLIMMLEVE